MDRSHRWQFSLTTLLILTAVVAVTSAAVSAPPSWVSGLALGFLSFAFPTAFVLVIVHGEGYWRTFCIGALVPSLEGCPHRSPSCSASAEHSIGRSRRLWAFLRLASAG